MCNKIREYMGYVDGDPTLGGPGRPTVEADKAFIGGYDRMGEDDKSIVYGAVERGGEVKTRVLSDKSRKTVSEAVKGTVNKGATLYTDSGSAFSAMGAHGYNHQQVNHHAREWVRGPVHTNTIEAFWLLVKRGISGTYVWCSKRHLETYLDEFEFRWNLRKSPHLMFPLLCKSFARPVLARAA